MGGKYEIRFIEGLGIREVYTNSWFEFMKIRLTKEIIYYKVYGG